MKKITSLFLVWFMSLSLVMAIPGFAGINDRDSDINLTKGNVVELPQISAPSGNPDSNEGWIYVKDSSGTTKLYFEDDAGTVHDLVGGQVKLVSKDNAAGAISLTANIGTSETITVTNTQGTDAAAINLTATAGGITAVTATGKAITLNGTVNNKVGSNVASPAGGELDLGDGNYFYITGTNNITSIAAADATAGRMIVLRFADILTFTDGNNLKLAGNFATTADDTITLICDGTNCYEMARSAN